VILGKTWMGVAVCVGGMVEATGKPVRLIPRHKGNHKSNTQFRVGEVWEMSLCPRDALVLPHMEDHDEWGARRVGEVADLVAYIKRVAKPHKGELTGLFGGLLHVRSTGTAYLLRDGILPAFSVGFWICPRDLTYYAADSKHRYRMLQAGSLPGTKPVTSLSIPYVGHEPPVQTIPAGALIRVSLARWWTNPHAPDEGESCSLQLSGWFGLPADAARVPLASPNLPFIPPRVETEGDTPR